MGTAQVQGQLWGDRAREWADLHEVGFEPLYHDALKTAGVGQGTSLLDIGCGSGLALTVAHATGARVSGLDAAEQSIAIAKSRVPGADLRVGEIEELPFADQAFEVVTGFNSFQYAADRVHALREARRVMRDDGRLVVAIWGPPDQCEYKDYLAALGALMPPPPPGAPGPWALSAEGALEELAGKAGLQTIASGNVTCPFRFRDDDTARRGLLAAGPAVRAIQVAGEDAVADAVMRAVARFKKPDGSYVLTNVFRYIIAQR